MQTENYTKFCAQTELRESVCLAFLLCIFAICVSFHLVCCCPALCKLRLEARSELFFPSHSISWSSGCISTCQSWSLSVLPEAEVWPPQKPKHRLANTSNAHDNKIRLSSFKTLVFPASKIQSLFWRVTLEERKWGHLNKQGSFSVDHDCPQQVFLAICLVFSRLSGRYNTLNLFAGQPCISCPPARAQLRQRSYWNK